MLRDSVVVRTRPRAIPLAMITIRKILHGFPFLSHDDYGALLGCPFGPLELRYYKIIEKMECISTRRYCIHGAPHCFSGFFRNWDGRRTSTRCAFHLPRTGLKNDCACH